MSHPSPPAKMLPEDIIRDIKSAVSFLADLNGSYWIKGDDPAEVDMRQRAKAQQKNLYAALQVILGKR